MKAIIFFILLTMLTIPTVFGQIKIGDNPQNIDPASVLELESSSKVLVITRVSTLEMEAITPQRGGIVYNTDTECIHYYDGTQWINLCDAVNFTITNDPIINNRATIEITQTADGYNLEIAKNGILGDNIVDGGIGPDDIQDNSITQEKLAAESVGSSELRENSVGTEELKAGSVRPVNIANDTPGQVLTTDENGIVQWGDASDLMGAVGDEITITGNGTNEDPIRLSIDIQNEIDAKEMLLNKDPNIQLGNSDILYPTQNAVRTYVNNRINDVVVSGDGDSINEQNLNFEVSNGNLEITDIDGTFSVPLTDLNNQLLSINANRLAITNGNDVDLNPYLDNTDEQILQINGNQLSITGLNGGNTINLPAAVAEIDGIVGNEILNATDGTLVRLGDGTAANPFTLDVATTAIGTAELANNAVTNEKLADNSVQSANITNGTITTIDIAPASAAPTTTQILTTSTIGVVGWIDLPTSSTELADGTTIIGDGTNTNRFRVNAIGSNQITDGSILLEDLNINNATNGQVIKWDENLNGGLGAWTVANDLTDGTGITTLASGTMLIGNATNVPSEITISGDATISDTGLLTIADNAIDLNNLSNMGATTTGQLLKWNQNTLAWELGTDATGTALTDADGNDGLSTFSTTTGYNLNVDNTTIEIFGDALQIKENAIDLDKLSPMGATITGQLLKWNQTTMAWELGTDATGSAVTDAEINDGLTDFNATSGYSVNVDDTTIEIVGDNLQIKEEGITTFEIKNATIEEADIKDDAITPVKISNGLDNQVLQTISGNTSWSHLTAPLNTGSILFSDGDGGITENNSQIYWDNNTSKLYLGTQITTTVDVKLNVGGTTRTQGIKNSPGSAGLPSYRFTDNGSTGMFLIDNVGVLGFSANNVEAMRIDDSQNIGIGPTFALNNTTIAAKLHVDGDIRAEGAITASGAINTVPDYVFQKYFLGNSILNPNYEFTNLSEIEAFVKLNNHLPGIKSAAAIKEQGFWDLGEASRINLEKIEELFLHTIEQEKKIKELESTNKNMASEVETLKAQMEEIKKLLLEKTKE